MAILTDTLVNGNLTANHCSLSATSALLAEVLNKTGVAKNKFLYYVGGVLTPCNEYGSGSLLLKFETGDTTYTLFNANASSDTTFDLTGDILGLSHGHGELNCDGCISTLYNTTMSGYICTMAIVNPGWDNPSSLFMDTTTQFSSDVSSHGILAQNGLWKGNLIYHTLNDDTLDILSEFSTDTEGQTSSIHAGLSIGNTSSTVKNDMPLVCENGLNYISPCLSSQDSYTNKVKTINSKLGFDIPVSYAITAKNANTTSYLTTATSIYDIAESNTILPLLNTLGDQTIKYTFEGSNSNRIYGIRIGYCNDATNSSSEGYTTKIFSGFIYVDAPNTDFRGVFFATFMMRGSGYTSSGTLYNRFSGTIIHNSTEVTNFSVGCIIRQNTNDTTYTHSFWIIPTTKDGTSQSYLTHSINVYVFSTCWTHSGFVNCAVSRSSSLYSAQDGIALMGTDF